MHKIDAIRFLMQKGHARELLQLIEGDSPYTTDDSEGAPHDPYLKRLWVIAVHHLRFVAEYGDREKFFCDGKYFHPHPSEFEQWLQAGAPGVGNEDIQACLRSVRDV